MGRAVPRPSATRISSASRQSSRRAPISSPTRSCSRPARSGARRSTRSRRSSIASISCAARWPRDLKPGAVAPGEYLRYQPLGVVGVIGPFNFPLHLCHAHVVPGAARWQHGRDQAERHHAAVRSALRRGGARRGAAAGRDQCRRRYGRGRRGDGRVAAICAACASPAAGRSAAASSRRRSIARSCWSRSRWAARTPASCSRTRRCARPFTRSSSAAICRRASAAPGPSACSCIARSPTASSTRSRRLVRELQFGNPEDAERVRRARSRRTARSTSSKARSRPRARRGAEPIVPGAKLPGGYYRTASLHRLPDGMHASPGYTDLEVFGPDLAIEVIDSDDEAIAVIDAIARTASSNAVFTGSPARFEEFVARTQVRHAQPQPLDEPREPEAAVRRRRAQRQLPAGRCVGASQRDGAGRDARERARRGRRRTRMLAKHPAARTTSIGSSASTPTRRRPRRRAGSSIMPRPMTLQRPHGRRAARERSAARAAVRGRSRAEGEEAAGVRSPALGRDRGWCRSIASRSPCSTA